MKYSQKTANVYTTSYEAVTGRTPFEGHDIANHDIILTQQRRS